jgi:type I restriction enzyme S subunit
MVKLGEVAQINPRCPKDIDASQKVSFIAMASASEDGYLLSEEIRVLSETRKGFTYFEKGDVLLAKITPCFENGKCLRPNQIVNDVGFGSTEFHVLRVNESILDSSYLFYMVWSDLFRFLGECSMSGAAGQKRISTDFIKKFEIPLPPLAEQKRIAAILDKADAIRSKRKQAIQLADDYLRSVFLDMFGDPVTNPKGWEVQSLSSLCKKITDGTHHSPPITECGVPYVTAKHLKKTGLEFHKNPWYISEESHQAIYSRCNPELNDVLYIKDGATTGLAAINDYDFEFSMLSSLALLKPDYDKITSEFLCMFLNHPRTKLVLTANMAGAAITRLTLAKIKDVKVPLPDLATQKKFSETYISVRNFLEKVASSSDLANQEFNSLSQKAFAGEL